MGDFRKSGNFGGNKRPYGFRPGGDRPHFGGSRGQDGPRPELFDATCANCGKSCQVPFRPTGERPVYCRDCFGEKRDTPPRNPGQRDGSRNFDRNGSSRPAPVMQHRDTRIDDIKRDVLMLNAKIDSLMKILGANVVPPPVKTVPEVSVVQTEKPTKKTPAKKAAKKK